MLGIVTGLKSEAKLVAGLGAAVISGGGQSEATRRKIDQLLAQRVRGLVSFGIAGGLDPALKTGALVLSGTVIDDAGQRYAGDPAWLQRALMLAPTAFAGHVYASDRIVDSATKKRELFTGFETVAADMESHHVARAAAAHGLPFLIIRAISDTASEALPAAFGDGVDADGNTRILPILLALLTGRLSLPAVIRAGQCASRAHATLRQGRGLIAALQT